MIPDEDDYDDEGWGDPLHDDCPYCGTGEFYSDDEEDDNQ